MLCLFPFAGEICKGNASAKKRHVLGLMSNIQGALDAKGWIMSNYEDQYYLVDEVYDDDTLYLKPKKKTANRDYEYTKMIYGDEPLFFENSYKDRDVNEGKERPIKTAHMDGNFLIVDDAIYREMKSFTIDNFQLYPAVVVDDKEAYHENFWFFNIYANSDYLDIDQCQIDDYDEDDKKHSIERYSLNEKLLDGILEERRLIFRPMRSDIGHTIVHQRIVDIFEELGVNNIKFYKLSE